MHRSVGILIGLVGGVLLASTAVAAQTPPALDRCLSPSRPIGVLSGTGTVRFRITEKGRVDSASIAVVRAEGVSPEGILSVARRWLPRCRYRPARQAGHAVALTVEQPLQFPVTGRALGAIHDASWQIHDEMPTAYDCHPGNVPVRQGRITLAFVIDTAGRPQASSMQLVAADVVTSPALLARLVKMCRYVPARDHGTPIDIYVGQQFVFEEH